MQYTQAQIDRANAVSLEDFLRTQGETLVKSGREYRWKEHDSLTVRGNKWFRHSQSKGGYPIDFVMEFYGKSFPEAVQLLTGESAEGQSEASTAPPTAFHRAFFIYRRILNEQYRNQQHHLPDCQKADWQDHLYRPCPFQRDRQGDDGGQNQAYAP